MAKKRNVKDETYNKLTLNVRKVNIAYKENSFKLSLIEIDSSGFFNRLASDGDIVTFNKDGSTVGSIGTAGGALYIGSTTGNDSYLAFYGDVCIIRKGSTPAPHALAQKVAQTLSLRGCAVYLDHAPKPFLRFPKIQFIITVF